VVPNASGALTRLQIETQVAALLAVSSELSADDCEIVARVSNALAEGQEFREPDIVALAAIARGMLERRLRAQVAGLLSVSESLSVDHNHLVQRVSDALAAGAEIDVADQAALAILADESAGFLPLDRWPSCHNRRELHVWKGTRKALHLETAPLQSR
jgi:hypothetical protein